MPTPDPVEKQIRLILAAYDPLPPWFSEASWDDDYYSDEAALIYTALPAATSVESVRHIVDGAFAQTMPALMAYLHRADDRLDERLAAIAHAIWDRLQP